MMQNGVLYQLEISELPTCENDGFVLPTPTAVQMQSQEMRERAITLAQKGEPLFQRRIKDGKKVEGKRNFTIEDALIYRTLLPTPKARTGGNEVHQPSSWRRLEKGMGDQLAAEVALSQGITKEDAIGSDFRLNPDYVTEMMGFPIDWLDLEH
jgi:hypothetical protein